MQIALLPQSIPRVVEVFDHGEVEVPHASSATYCTDERGRDWVRKRKLHCGANDMLAEALAWLLARAIRAPVPEAAIYESATDPDESSWLSRRILSFRHLSQLGTSTVTWTNLPEFGAVLALDAVLWVEDRHMLNILAEPVPPERWRIWGIDFGRGLVGDPVAFEGVGLDAPPVDQVARGLDIVACEPGAQAAAAALSRLESTRIEAFVAEAAGFADEPDPARISTTLVRRLAAAPEIVARYLSSLRSRP